MFLFRDWFLSHEVCISTQYFFGLVRNISFRTPSTKYLLQLTKRRSKVQEKNMSCDALNFDQWKTLSENYKLMRDGLFTNSLRIIVACDFSPSLFKLKELSYLSWQNTYPNLKTACHTKLKFFPSTRILTYFLQNISYLSLRPPLSTDRTIIFMLLWTMTLSNVVYLF